MFVPYAHYCPRCGKFIPNTAAHEGNQGARECAAYIKKKVTK